MLYLQIVLFVSVLIPYTVTVICSRSCWTKESLHFSIIM